VIKAAFPLGKGEGGRKTLGSTGEERTGKPKNKTVFEIRKFFQKRESKKNV